MSKFELLVRLEVNPGQQAALAAAALQFGHSTFGVFDAFACPAGLDRDAANSPRNLDA